MSDGKVTESGMDCGSSRRSLRAQCQW